MFQKITDLSFKRNTKQAIGFYLLYLTFYFFTILGLTFLLRIILYNFYDQIPPGFINYIFQSSSLSSAYEALAYKPLIFSSLFGSAMSVPTILIINSLILKQKNQLKNIKYILLTLLSVPISLLSGVLGGLIFSAYLTTKPTIQ